MMEYFSAFTSSNVARIGYDNVAGILEVTFHNGSTYHYYDVPQHIWESFKAAPSQGQFLNSQVKGYYRYSRV